jgi:hypothetical protein
MRSRGGRSEISPIVFTDNHPAVIDCLCPSGYRTGTIVKLESVMRKEKAMRVCRAHPYTTHNLIAAVYA